ncbi:hypothetical protein BJ508DRAFT_67484 [Ascobolus immersus RN42]|uniref:Uncharacterized protein n=1 Tax=Ascobolus immersus RN42 TaxID=1160509 RepID=A0A3N4HH10_ASCIM|nr:hypothetical protein BJ508DRAFT_67484 [Ascobolus immersus RN42]
MATTDPSTSETFPDGFFLEIEDVNLANLNVNVLEQLAASLNINTEDLLTDDAGQDVSDAVYESELVRELTDTLELAQTFASCDDSHMRGFSKTFGLNYNDYIEDPETDSTESLREALIELVNDAIIEAKTSQLVAVNSARRSKGEKILKELDDQPELKNTDEVVAKRDEVKQAREEELVRREEERLNALPSIDDNPKKVFYPDGSRVPHARPTPNDMPGICTCKYHNDKISGPSKGSSTRYYIMSHPGPGKRSLEHCKIRIVYDSVKPVEPEGDQEAPGEFSHDNFLYDTKFDYPFGKSKRRHGTRRGTPKPIGKKAARLRLGFPDAAFLPYDCPYNQYQIKRLNRAQAKKGAGKAATKTPATPRRGAGSKASARKSTSRNTGSPNGEDDEDEDDIIDELGGPAELPLVQKDVLNYGVTDSKILQSSPLHSIFTTECKAFIKKYGFHLKGSQDRPGHQENWFKMLVEIVENSQVLAPAVKHQLLNGVYQEIVEPAPNAQELYDQYMALPENADTEFDDDVDPLDMFTVTTRIASHLLQMWDQERRFLWPALESVVEGSVKTAISQIRAEELFAQSVAMYSGYFNPDPEAFDENDIPDHPHAYDPPVNEESGKKRKAATTSKAPAKKQQKKA